MDHSLAGVPMELWIPLLLEAFGFCHDFPYNRWGGIVLATNRGYHAREELKLRCEL
jgi:hypothetical protein